MEPMRTLAWTMAAMLMAASGAVAEACQAPSPEPSITAAPAGWQVENEPILFQGSLYYPAGPTVFFDPNVMGLSGNWRGVPLYQDSSIEPNSVLLVPIGRGLMRPYERRRTGEPAASTAVDQREARDAANPAPPDAVASRPREASPFPIPARWNRGLWIPFNGSVWSLAGEAVAYAADRFTKIGEYHGQPVYRRGGDRKTIYVPSTADGPIAPYQQR